MPKIPFDSNNKAKTDFDYPKLYLDHNERARIVCIEPEPEVGWIHTLRAPKIINGVLQMETVKTKDGGTIEKPATEFIGKHMCFGNIDKLLENDKDPANCPTCAKANENDAVGPATRRFAMHVVQYKTQPGKFQIQTPFQAELVVWGFTNQRYNTITDIKEEHGDLRQKDLLLGPCENKNFQNYDIQVGGTAEWLADEERKNFVARLYAENKLDDLSPAFARKISREMAANDVEKVLIKHAQAYGGGAVDPVPGGTEASAVDLSNLLGGDTTTQTPVAETTPAAPAEPAPEATSDPLADLGLGGSPAEAATPEAATEPVSVPDAPAEAEQKTEQVLDFDSLLKGL